MIGIILAFEQSMRFSLFSRSQKVAPDSQSRPERRSEHRYVPLICGTLSEYVAAVHDLAWCRETFDAPVFPLLRTQSQSVQKPYVLYTPSPSYPQLKDLSAAALVTSSARNAGCYSDTLLVLPEQDDHTLAAIGAAYSRLTQRRFAGSLRDLETAERVPESLFVLTLRTYLERHTFYSLQAELRTSLNIGNEVSLPPWGILSVDEPSELTDFLARNYSYTPPARMLVRHYDFHSAGLASETEELTVVDGSNSPDAFASVVSLPKADVLGILDHSSSYCLKSGLCSGTIDESSGQRVCVAGFDCILAARAGDAALPRLARDLESPIVFLGGCRAGGFQWPHNCTNLVETLLRGQPIAAVAAHHVHNYGQTDPMLFYLFLQRGMSLGEACQALNLHCGTRLQFRNQTLILFGDPTLRLQKTPSPTSTISVDWDAQFARGTLQLPKTTQPFLLLDLEPCDQLPIGAERLHIGADALLPFRTSASLLRLPDKRQCLFLANPERAALGAVKITISRAFEVDLDAFIRAHLIQANAERLLSAVGAISYDQTKNATELLMCAAETRDTLREALQRAETALCALNHGATVDLQLGLVLRSLESEVVDAASALSMQLLEAAEKLRKRAILQTRFGLPQCVLSLRHGVNKCRSCEGEVVERSHSLGALYAVRRLDTECLRCGVETNCPEEWHPVKLTGPPVVQIGNRCDLTIEFKNTTRRAVVQMRFCLFVDWMHVEELDIDPDELFQPRSCERVLEIDATWQQVVQVSPTRGMPAHMYRVGVLVSVNGEIGTLYHYLKVHH